MYLGNALNLLSIDDIFRRYWWPFLYWETCNCKYYCYKWVY